MSGSKLDGRVAIVTGAAQGIGRAITLKLVSEGTSVLANDLDAERLAVLKTDSAAMSGSCEVFPGDVTATDFGDRAVAIASALAFLFVIAFGSEPARESTPPLAHRAAR